MTDEQLAVAQKHQAHHAEVFGFDNVRFLKSYIERLDGLDLAPGSFDVIVSNCVVDFSPDKPAVLRGVERLLKPGGGLNFSDVFADRRRQATQGRAGGLHAQAADHAQCHGPHTTA